MEIRIDDPRRDQPACLLREHLEDMAAQSPPESIHALDSHTLATSSAITFWTGWEGGELVGCGALLELDPDHGEIKSMRTANAHRRKGVAAEILQHIIAEAQRRSYERLSLETGSMEAFAPAQSLYASFDFVYCEPFGDYILDPNSVFMTRTI